MSSVSEILAQIDAGEPGASKELRPLVYEELRRLAAAKLSNEVAGQTLQATALVHEAYLRAATVVLQPVSLTRDEACFILVSGSSVREFGVFPEAQVGSI